ncbi:hypothetical protein E2P81_ATG08246 [Venturia nashicola]|uniref:Uncharacterized protein n=1 Tax=Venturia nashicola TaxID=86259 RepID=A0A4Z1NV56_9PEZI|nr:hypothetical protein E6O75_ATG08425 [Venturia nashicola]TLD21658.1 hypothetical protein E2P81_ATG08246 [Venturia nashicola]
MGPMFRGCNLASVDVYAIGTASLATMQYLGEAMRQRPLFEFPARGPIVGRTDTQITNSAGIIVNVSVTLDLNFLYSGRHSRYRHAFGGKQGGNLENLISNVYNK